MCFYRVFSAAWISLKKFCWETSKVGFPEKVVEVWEGNRWKRLAERVKIPKLEHVLFHVLDLRTNKPSLSGRGRRSRIFSDAVELAQKSMQMSLDSSGKLCAAISSFLDSAILIVTFNLSEIQKFGRKNVSLERSSKSNLAKSLPSFSISKKLIWTEIISHSKLPCILRLLHFQWYMP